MAFEIIDCQQGSKDWFNLRMGIPTASNFSTLLVRPPKGEVLGKGAVTYLHKLAGERLMGEPQQNYNNAHMDRGHENEPKARIAYYFETGNDVRQVGFIRNEMAGYSPDGLVGDNGLIEIKDRLPHLQIKTIVDGVTPAEYMAQIQGGLWVSEREWCDFVSYCPRLLKPFVKREYRDDVMIKNIEEMVSVFNNELCVLIEKLKKWELQ